MSSNAWFGESLVSGVGSWKYPGTTYARQWERCEADGSSCATLSGEKGAAYVLRADDLGRRLRVRISADSNGPNTFPAAVEAFTPLSDVVTLAPVPAAPAPGGGGGGPAPAQARPTPSRPRSPRSPSPRRSRAASRSRSSPRLSEGGTLSVRLERLVAGHKKGKLCKAGGKRGRKCTAVKPAGTFTLAAGAASLKVKLAAGQLPRGGDAGRHRGQPRRRADARVQGHPPLNGFGARSGIPGALRRGQAFSAISLRRCGNAIPPTISRRALEVTAKSQLRARLRLMARKQTAPWLAVPWQFLGANPNHVAGV